MVNLVNQLVDSYLSVTIIDSTGKLVISMIVSWIKISTLGIYFFVSNIITCNLSDAIENASVAPALTRHDSETTDVTNLYKYYNYLPRIKIIHMRDYTVRIAVEQVPSVMVVQKRVGITLWFALYPNDTKFLDHIQIPYVFDEMQYLEVILKESLHGYRKIRAVMRFGQDSNDLTIHPPTSSAPLATMWDECILLHETMIDELRIIEDYHDDYRNIILANDNQTSINPQDQLIRFYVESIQQSLQLARSNNSQLTTVELNWKGYSGLQFRYL